jgi:hypothetical protein
VDPTRLREVHRQIAAEREIAIHRLADRSRREPLNAK